MISRAHGIILASTTQWSRSAQIGRPFKTELLSLGSTYRWSLALDISRLAEQLESTRSRPLLVVGSGGSQSTAHLIANLHMNRFGQLSKAETPLLATSDLNRLKSCGVLLVSASGRNPDILGVARAAVRAEPPVLLALCAAQGSPLATVVQSFSRGFCFEFDLPTGKDGFLQPTVFLRLASLR
jgi:DNA-binding MurR/RpiR family transcriptional regulator